MFQDGILSTDIKAVSNFTPLQLLLIPCIVWQILRSYLFSSGSHILRTGWQGLAWELLKPKVNGEKHVFSFCFCGWVVGYDFLWRLRVVCLYFQRDGTTLRISSVQRVMNGFQLNSVFPSLTVQHTLGWMTQTEVRLKSASSIPASPIS